MIYGSAHLEFIDPADHLVDGAETQLCHQFAHLFGDEAHEIHDVFRVPGELLA